MNGFAHTGEPSRVRWSISIAATVSTVATPIAAANHSDGRCQVRIRAVGNVAAGGSTVVVMRSSQYG